MVVPFTFMIVQNKQISYLIKLKNILKFVGGKKYYGNDYKDYQRE